MNEAGQEHDAIVCGAGAAGLACAAVLKQVGLSPVVLERGERVATTWRGRYDTLRLNTLGWMSRQPGLRVSLRRYGEFPHRDRWIQYLEDYAAHHRLDVRFGTEVRRIERGEGGWRVCTAGERLNAARVVVATGFDHDPDLPDWPGREGFEGELIHASQYRNAAPFRGRDVLIVGAGTTGSELSHFVADGGARRVRVACRTPPNIFPRRFLGLPINVNAPALALLPPRVADVIARSMQRLIYGDLSEVGLPFPPLGVVSTLERKQQGPAIDCGFVEGVKSGRIEIVAAVTGFEGADVLLADGSRLQPEVVMAATGYRRGLEPLVGHLGVLRRDGRPLVGGGDEHPAAPGLHFVGYVSPLPGQLRQMRLEARHLGRAVRRRGRGPAGAHRAAGGQASTRSVPA